MANNADETDLFLSANIPAEMRLIFSVDGGGVVDLRRCGSDVCRIVDFLVLLWALLFWMGEGV